MSLVDHFLAEHARLAAQLPGAGHPAVDAERAEALAHFRQLGVPSGRLEDWKYTSLAALERQPLPVAEDPAAAGLVELRLADVLNQVLETHRDLAMDVASALFNIRG